MNHDDGRTLLGALAATDREVLAVSLAALDKSGLATQIYHAATGKLTDDPDAWRTAVKQASRGYAALDTVELMFRLLERMETLLGVEHGAAESVQALEDRCKDVAVATVALVNRSEAGELDGLDSLVRHELTTMLDRVDPSQAADTFARLDTAGQESLIGQVREFVSALPEEAQARFLKAAGITELSDDYIRNAALAGGLTAGFSAIVGVAGFGAYTFATSTLASVAGLVGLTLPFSAYVGLTSAVAVLANPLFIIATLGVVSFGYSKASKQLRKNQIPLLIADLVLRASVSAAPVQSDTARCAVVLWNEAAECVRAARAAEAECELSRASRRAERISAQAQVKAANAVLDGVDEQRRELVAHVAIRLRELCAFDGNVLRGDDRFSRLVELNQQVETNRVKPEGEGVLKAASRTASRWLDEGALKQEADARAAELCEESDGTVSPDDEELGSLFRHLTEIDDSRATAREARNFAKAKAERACEAEHAAKAALKDARDLRAEVESRFEGLAEHA